MALIPEDYIDSVVAIGVHIDSQKNWIGTGFLFGDLHSKTEDTGNLYTIYLVTNKHVIEGLDKVVLKFNPQSNQSSKDFNLNLNDENKNKRWVGHPDPEVDVAVIKLNPNPLNDAGMKFKFFQSDKNIITSSEMNKEHIREGNFLYVLGFPMGIVSSDRQYVFARVGIISRIKDLYEKRSKDFIIDATVFPGNSGGPVILKIEDNALIGSKPVNKSSLIGIIKSYIPYHDTAYSMQTKKPRITFEENSGLTLVEPVEKIIETIEMYNKNYNNKR